MSHRRFLLILGFSSFLVACGGETDDQQNQSGAYSEDVKKEASEAYEALEAYAMKKKDQFLEQAEVTLKSYEERIDELKARAEEASGEAKKKIETAMQEWDAKKQTLIEKIEEMKAASAERWQKLEEQVDAAMEELKQLYEQARSAFS